MADPQNGYYLEPGYAPDTPDPTGRWREPGLAEIVRAEASGGVLPPVNISPPTISGTAQVGQVLTRVNGTWANSPTSFAHQWYAGGVAISGATAATYTPVTGDIGKAITVSTVATNAAGSSAMVTSAATAAVIAASGSALGPATASFLSGTSVGAAAAGATVAALTGLQSGETATSLSPNDGRVAISSDGLSLVRGGTVSAPGTTAYTVTTSAGRTLSISIIAMAYLAETQAVAVPAFPNDRIAAGAFTSIIAVHADRKTVAHAQSITADIAQFPGGGATIAWTWPDDGYTGVSTWAYTGWGNYLDNTVVKAPIAAARIQDITNLTQVGDFAYSAGLNSANATIDFFLFNDKSGTTAQIACEIQIYMHTPQNTRDVFLENYNVVSNLGTFTTPAVGSTPSIVWKASRQGVNAQGKPYYQFFATNGAGPNGQGKYTAIDVLAGTTIQVHRFFAFLMAANPVTGATYLTGAEIMTGIGMGVETIAGAGSFRFNSYDVQYAFNIPVVSSALPAATNMAKFTNFGDAFWTGEGTVPSANKVLETAVNGQHIIRYTNPVPLWPLTDYSVLIDTDTALGRSVAFPQFFDGGYGGNNAQAYLDNANYSVSAQTSAGFTNVAFDVLKLDNGRQRDVTSFTTPSFASTQPSLRLNLSISPAAGTSSYPGDTSKGLNLYNHYLWSPSGVNAASAANRIAMSGDFGQSAWTLTGVTPASPNLLLETATTGVHSARQDIAKTAQRENRVLTFEVKAASVSGGGRDWVYGTIGNAEDSATIAFSVNATTGAFGTITGSGDMAPATGSIASIGGGVSRVTLPFATDASAGLRLRIGPATADNTPSYAGDVTKGIALNKIKIPDGTVIAAVSPTTNRAAPPVTSGLVGYIDPSVSTLTMGTTDTTKVVAISAAGGTPYAATQATESLAPVLVANVTTGTAGNSAKALRFVASSAHRMDWGALASAVGSGGGPETIVAILKQNSIGATQTVIEHADPTKSDTQTRSAMLMSAGSRAYRARRAIAAGGSLDVNSAQTSVVAGNTNLVMITSSGTTNADRATITVNHEATITGNTAGLGTPASTTTIGGQMATPSGGALTASLPFDGDVYAIMVFNRVLTASEVTTIADWSKAVFGTA